MKGLLNQLCRCVASKKIEGEKYDGLQARSYFLTLLSMSATVRHCSYCRETTHARKTCPVRLAAAEESRRREEATLHALEAERVAKAAAEHAELAAQPTQTQLLTLYDAIKTLQQTVSELKETCQLQKEEIASLERRLGEIY
jgi:chromosome segregation ATPase